MLIQFGNVVIEPSEIVSLEELHGPREGWTCIRVKDPRPEGPDGRLVMSANIRLDEVAAILRRHGHLLAPVREERNADGQTGD